MFSQAANGAVWSTFLASAFQVAQFLGHGRHSLGPNMAQLGSGAEHLKTISCVVAQQAFGHLASR